MRAVQILFLFLMFIVVSCTTSPLEEFVVGKNFIKDQAGISKIDTLTIQSSVVKLDSVFSNSAGRLLVGSNYNFFSGYKTANSLMTIKFDGSIENQKFIYDSICFVLSYDKYYSGDTTVTQTIGVHQVLEKMELQSGYLYTTSKFKYDASPLGTISFKPRPKSKDALSIRLSDEFGTMLAQMIKDKNETLTSPELFAKFIYGIMLKTESETKGAVLGFRTTDASASSGGTGSTVTKNKPTKPEIRLYYHLSPNPSDLHDLYYKFSFATDGINFNQISENQTNSLIDGIENTNNERISKLTDSQVLIQSGVQIFTKLKVPYLDNLLKSSPNSAVVGAVLRLYPVKGTYNKASELPDSLYIYQANKNNSLVGQITLPGTTDKYVFGRLVIDYNMDRQVYYEADISAFIEAEIKDQSETTNSLFIGYGSTKAKRTTDHVVLGGIRSGIYSPDLSVFFYHN